jgi:aspartyl-tRNA(Asn)/glutamyl-tRNA(Gln) amidotransferase subunit A
VNQPWSLAQLSQAVRQRKISPREVIRHCLERIGKLDPAIHAFHEVLAEQAMSAAAGLERIISNGEDPGQLCGVPIALKDNIATEFGHTTCGSRMLQSYRSPYSATVVRRLVNAGAIIIGKTTCDEFAMGSSTEHCAFGLCRNPWDHARVPGGSSGGSAAAVACGMVQAALGSETGGSVRQPASFCGVVGVKPSYGRVSRYGLVAFASSLDQVGPLAGSVEDAAVVLNVIAGVDRHDSTSSPMPVPDFRAQLDQPIEDLRVGVPRQYINPDNDPAVNSAIRGAMDVYKKLGASIVDLELPSTEYGIATYYVLAPAEAASNLARFDGVRYGRRAKLEPGEDLSHLYARSRSEGFGPEVQRRIMLGTYVLSAGYYEAFYRRAQQARRLIKQELDQAFEQCHVILGPTAPTPAFAIGSKADPLSMYLSDVYTVNTNIAGVCGISIPCGFAEIGGARLPIGLHLQCPAFEEMTLFRAASMFERATDYGASAQSLRTAS